MARSRLRFVLVIVVLAGMLLASGCSSGSPSGRTGSVAPAPPGTSRSSASSDRLVIKTVSMEVRVEDLAAAVTTLRRVADSTGGSVDQLDVSSDSGSNTNAQQTSGQSIPGPAHATLTLRIPADRLAQAEEDTSKLGRVVSQSADVSDVTEKHIDLTARLQNSQAEESRLRQVLARATGINDVLAVERELSRVQGDIESMQAELAHLNGQIAMATLNITLDEPGPAASPWAVDWGVGDAFSNGLQGTAGMVRLLIMTTLTLSPLIVLALIVWAVIHVLRRRRRAKFTQQPAPTPATEQPGVPPVGPGDVPRS